MLSFLPLIKNRIIGIKFGRCQKHVCSSFYVLCLCELLIVPLGYQNTLSWILYMGTKSYVSVELGHTIYIHNYKDNGHYYRIVSFVSKMLFTKTCSVRSCYWVFILRKLHKQFAIEIDYLNVRLCKFLIIFLDLYRKILRIVILIYVCQ